VATLCTPSNTPQSASAPYRFSPLLCHVEYINCRTCPGPAAFCPQNHSFMSVDPTHGSWSPPESTPKRHLDRFSRLYTAHGRESLYFTIGCHFSASKLDHGSGICMDPYRMHGSLGQPECTSKTSSRLVQLFLRGSRSLLADRHRDRQTYVRRILHLCNGPHLASAAKRPKMS